ncbi:MAG: GatB/YqeY domain-containing protein [Proteobacteria bacterium]|nr:GatB/YqeY domain-containing protein [Pseudomonadota bacterium]
MTILNDMQEQVKLAMKSGDARRRDALRLVQSALKKEFIDNGRVDLTPEKEIAVLSSEAKKRRESIDAYKLAGAEERAEQEAYELAIIQEFLPAGLSEDDVKKMIDELVAELQITSKKDLGKLMKSLMPKIKGRFPGDQAKKLVDSLNIE